MRLTLTTSLAAILFGLLSTGGTQAAISPEAITKVLSECPVEARVGTCANAVIDFANALPQDAERDDDLLALAGELAEEAAGQQVSPIICLELETSIRLAGRAAAVATTRDAIVAIADNLCGEIDYTATGSVRGGNGSADNADGTDGNGGGGDSDDDGNGPFPPPTSVIDPEDKDDAAPPPVTPPVTPPDGGDDGDGDGGDDDIPDIEVN